MGGWVRASEKERYAGLVQRDGGGRGSIGAQQGGPLRAEQAVEETVNHGGLVCRDEGGEVLLRRK